MFEFIQRWLRRKKLESYYTYKYPFKDITYRRTDKLGTRQIDVRQFLNYHNFMLPELVGETDDEKAIEGLQWVISNIKYTPDANQYKNNEYWAHGYETFYNGKGDCEDGAIILHDILRKNGVPAWKLRITAGFVKLGGKKVGHAYLTYFCEKTERWVILDWCFWPNLMRVNLRPAYYNKKNYIDVWFSFNEEYSWAKVVGKDAKEVLNQ